MKFRSIITFAALAMLSMLVLAPSSFAAPLKPDLIPHSFTLKSNKGLTSKAVLPIKTVFKNKGKASSVKSVATVFVSKDAKLGKGDLKIATTPVRALGKGRAQTIYLKTRLPNVALATNYKLIFCIDTPNRIKEQNERNNCETSEEVVTIYPLNNQSAETASLALAYDNLRNAPDAASYCALTTARFQTDLLELLEYVADQKFASCAEGLSYMLATYPEAGEDKPLDLPNAYMSVVADKGVITSVEKIDMTEVFNKTFSEWTIIHTYTFVRQADANWLLDVSDSITSTGGGFE